MAYHRYHGLNTRIVRIFNTYGPRMRMRDGRVVPNFIMPGAQRRAADGLRRRRSRRAASNTSTIWSTGSQAARSRRSRLPVNIGNPHEMTVLEFAKKIIELTGSKSSIVYKTAAGGRSAGAPARHHQGQKRFSAGSPRWTWKRAWPRPSNISARGWRSETMKIVVTGGAGFIASHIVDAYIGRGHEVHIFDDLSTGQAQNLNAKATIAPGRYRRSPKRRS